MITNKNSRLFPTPIYVDKESLFTLAQVILRNVKDMDTDDICIISQDNTLDKIIISFRNQGIEYNSIYV